MAFVELDAQAVSCIKTFLKENGVKDPIRIDIQSTGCCDPSLGLCVDKAREYDLVCESDGVEFLIHPATHQTVGDVKITCSDDVGSQGYILTSSRPLSEWEGFGVCHIRLTSDD
jgi:Fe-S cluster assembly iron-binding protein IscA